VVEPIPVVAEILSLNNTAITEMTMLDNSNVDAEHLAMMKMMTDIYTQTHHYHSVIQIQSNRLEAAHL